MSVDVTPLFEPLKVRDKEFRNRIVMPPMVANRGVATPDGVEWYGQHAKGGVALVIVEATAVNRFGEELTVDSLKALVDAIHDGGALAAIQLFPVTFDFPRAGPDPVPDEVDREDPACCSQLSIAPSPRLGGAGRAQFYPRRQEGNAIEHVLDPQCGV